MYRFVTQLAQPGLLLSLLLALAVANLWRRRRETRRRRQNPSAPRSTSSSRAAG